MISHQSSVLEYEYFLQSALSGGQYEYEYSPARPDFRDALAVFCRLSVYASRLVNILLMGG